MKTNCKNMKTNCKNMRTNCNNIGTFFCYTMTRFKTHNLAGNGSHVDIALAMKVLCSHSDL